MTDAEEQSAPSSAPVEEPPQLERKIIGRESIITSGEESFLDKRLNTSLVLYVWIYQGSNIGQVFQINA